MQFLVSEKNDPHRAKKKKSESEAEQINEKKRPVSTAVIFYLNSYDMYYQERLIDLYDTYYNNADNASLLGPLLEFQSEICSVVVDGRQLRMQSPNDAAVRANNASFLVGR